MKKFRFLIPVFIITIFLLLATTQTFAGGAVTIVEDHPASGVTKFLEGITTIFYGEDTCADKCRFSQTITKPAYRDLDQVPKPYYTGVYTRTKNAEGSYTVCFDVRLVRNPAIYRYDTHQNLWIFVTDNVASDGSYLDTICANGTGDGVIGLFGRLTEKKEPSYTVTPLPDQIPN